MFLTILNHRTGRAETIKMQGAEEPKKESLKHFVFARVGHVETSFFLSESAVKKIEVNLSKN